jgi:hypothetical protein
VSILPIVYFYIFPIHFRNYPLLTFEIFRKTFEKEIQFKIIAQQLKNSKEGFRKRTSSIFGNTATQYLATLQ